MSTDLISIAEPGLPPRKRETAKGMEKDEKDENMTFLVNSELQQWSLYMRLLDCSNTRDECVREAKLKGLRD